MRITRNFVVKPSSVMLRVFMVSTVFLFVAMSDALLSYWVPPFLQEKLGSAFLMGIVMSFSSVVGLITDLILPQLIQGWNVRRLVSFAVVVSASFIGSLVLGLGAPGIIVFLIAMAIWGVYYEFLGFARQQFIANSTPHDMHASAQALLLTFYSLAYTIGPIIAGVLVLGGDTHVLFAAGMLLTIGVVLMKILLPKNHTHIDVEIKKINIAAEVGHWKVLFSAVWPIVLMSLMIGLIDSVFWTSGTVLSERLAGESVLGNFLVPAYMLPSLFMGFVVMRMNIVSGKKRLSQISMLVAGALLFLVGFSQNILMLIAVVFISSIFIAFSYPLVEAVYSDVIERMGRKRWHLIGLGSSTASIAYIVGPILAGALSSSFGERSTFAFLGVLTVAVAFLLLVMTPKKLHIPQEVVSKWKD